ncbi:dihydrodipicolinate reductase [Streptomyces sp. T028]|uniref:NAD(P)H-dependent amine dehydrogenase family protein n=1 Tax=Streptomyces sp. T028 TaxID=3394379 RepID=UPI003A890378
MSDKRYRVAQWGTGHSGMAALRALIDHPQYDLVGVHVHSDGKAGRDAGELSGKETTGVLATQDIEDIVAAKPDCVVYMPVTYDLDELCRLLEAGVNVSTLLEHFHDPEALDPEVRRRIEESCRRGGASLFSAGTSPGFVTEALPVVLTSLQRRLDRLTIHEYADISERNSPEMLSMLFGGDPAAAHVTGVAASTKEHYGSSLRRLARTLSIPLDDITATAEVAVSTRPLTTAAGTFEAGTVAAWRIEIQGVRAGEPVLRMIPTWYIATDLDPAWEFPFEGQGWRVVVDGDVPLDTTIRFTWPTEKERSLVGYGNASRPVNAVPYVCAAPPGIVTSFELPQIIAHLG